MRYLLRIEGVNLSNVIDDTDQLSVRRGGGLMLLNVATQLKGLLRHEVSDKLKPIATGASIGLFEFEAQGDGFTDVEANAEVIRDAVERFLNCDGSLAYCKLLRDHRFADKESHLPLGHATFVVDVVGVQDDDVQQAEQRAVAKNRWRQLKQPTLSLNGLWEPSSEFCTMDRIHPATKTMDINDDTKDVPVCETTCDRWHYGRGARQTFYLQELATDDATQLKFTDDIQQLSGRSKESSRSEPPAAAFDIPDNLVDKIAIFYVDGNKFGTKGRAIFKENGADGYRAWSEALKSHHRQLLAGLIKLTDNDPLWKNGEEIRLETLLWGGDEILWVVPAWKGWEVAKWFFAQKHSVNISIGKQKLDTNNLEQSLTYACGLVFCHAKAPIKNTTALAKKLGDLAKVGRSEEHSVAYEVLESYDDISSDLEEHRRRFLPANSNVRDLILNPTVLCKHWNVLTKFAHSPEIPIRQLYKLYDGWKRGVSHAAHEKRLLAACKEAQLKLDDWLITETGTQAIQHEMTETQCTEENQLVSQPVRWLHLHQMRPYLPQPSVNTDPGAKP